MCICIYARIIIISDGNNIPQDYAGILPVGSNSMHIES